MITVGVGDNLFSLLAVAGYPIFVLKSHGLPCAAVRYKRCLLARIFLWVEWERLFLLR